MARTRREDVPVSGWDEARVLVVAHRTAASPALLDALRDRADRGAAHFYLLVPNSPQVNWHLLHRERFQKVTHAEEVLLLALPLIEEAVGDSVECSVSHREDPMDAIEETLMELQFDEIILSTLPRSVSRWLHMDLPRRVAHLGVPVTTIVGPERAAAGVA
jgi:nucleotide-binding universal stress UspA family protein